MKRFLQQVANWELWPFYIIYTPLGFVWLYYALKARAFWFFSPVNPTIEFSGFEGESKKEMYEQLPQKYFPKTIFVSSEEPLDNVIKSVAKANFVYPFVVKPQVGMQALMFRKIDNEKQLVGYHQSITTDYIVQDFIELPMEFSLFHIRYPGQKKGFVTGFILKDYLAVTGDGKSTLLELIRNDERAKHREEEMVKRHSKCLNCVVPKHEKFYLSIAGNHNRGARFINLRHEIDERLCAVFDKISNEAGEFYFGRYDFKCTSIEDLKAGKNISILEFNGVGSEPNHIYDCNLSYGKALKEVVKHWQHLYEIGKINNKKGVPYWGFKKGYTYLRNAKRYFKYLRQLDLECTI